MVAPFLRENAVGASDLTCVCCNCQRVRIVADEWHEYTPAVGQRLTHGICPACLDVLYPDLAPLVRAHS